MKILHLNTFNNNSGASIAAKRLIEAQNLNDINSVLLYSKGLPNSKYYKKLNCSTINQVISYLESFLNIINGSYKGFNSNLLSASGVLKEINRINPDIVHLHWIHGGFISVEILKKN